MTKPKPKVIVSGRRPLVIRTVYFFNAKAVRVNHASSPLRAAELALRHLRKNHYQSDVAEITSTVTGKLYSVARRSIDGTDVSTIFKATPSKDE